MIRDLKRGAAGGVVATACMSALMIAGDRAGLMRDQPPKRIMRAFLPGHKRRPKPGEGMLGAIAHFAFGAAAGALFAVVVDGRRARPQLGAVYGMAIWAASYQGWVPAMGILPPAHRDRPGRQAVMAAAHVVYGTTLVMTLNGMPSELPGTAAGGPSARARHRRPAYARA
ncbi:DUF6789 family protein [Sphaerisporangium sp. TRM90804]|uniref:DUF6789 family protein n=1 Tax=Sphaerisporangium sp. TRM90804 TaxID=3031113 RepID=UPI002448C279|nr:DUF6789 family protein [Sphaerisporangium sp. TRM90804]MDH2430359.1 hypothetical protein [Sphaerisporangium sp. TRM90804]